MNRKTFLKLLPAIPAGVGAVVKMVDVPTIYGDGVHDDGPGLTAFFNNQPYRDLTGKLVRNLTEEPQVYTGNGATLFIKTRFHIPSNMVPRIISHFCFAPHPAKLPSEGYIYVG